LNRWVEFLNAGTSDAVRRQLLADSGAQYLLFSQKHPNALQVNAQNVLFLGAPAPSYLRRIGRASNADADVYEVEMTK
jgi:hypothetical protein